MGHPDSQRQLAPGRVELDGARDHLARQQLDRVAQVRGGGVDLGNAMARKSRCVSVELYLGLQIGCALVHGHRPEQLPAMAGDQTLLDALL
jgi:hypothetical protein